MKEWYRCSADEVLREFGTSSAGLNRKEVIRRRRQFGAVSYTHLTLPTTDVV